MGNLCGQICHDKKVQAVVEVTLREMKKEILDCIKSELTQSRTPPQISEGNPSCSKTSTSELNTQSEEEKK